MFRIKRSRLAHWLRARSPNESLFIFTGSELAVRAATYVSLYYFAVNRLAVSTAIALFWLRWEVRLHMPIHLLPNAKKSNAWPYIEKGLTPLRHATKRLYRKFRRNRLARLASQRSSRHASP